jgi:PAS domain S-box-containing protein
MALLAGLLFWVADSVYLTWMGDEHLRDMVFEAPTDFWGALGRDVPAYALFTRTAFLVACLVAGLVISHLLQRRLQSQLEQEEVRRRYESYVQSAPIGILICDPRGRHLEANPAMCQMLGYSEEELLIRNAGDLAVPKFRDTYLQMFQRLTEDGSAQLEVPLKHKTGRTVEAIVRTVRISENRFAAFCHDITNRKHAEREREHYLQQYRELLESINDGFFSLDEEMRVTYFNQTAGELLGRAPGEVIGRPLFEAFPEARGSIFEQKYRHALEYKEFVSFETYFDAPRYANWYDIRAYPKQNGLTVIFQVVTARKQAEEALRKSEERLHLALRGADLGLWDYNIPQEIVHTNPRSCEMLRYAPHEVPPDSDWWFSKVHPEDQQQLRDAWQAHLDGRSPRLDCEYRIECKDGNWRWLLQRGMVIGRDDDGTATRAAGTLLDITDRRQAEQALIESETRFRAIFESSLDAIVIWDKDLRYLYANQTAADILDLSPADMKGKTLHAVFADHPDVANAWAEEIGKVFRTGEPSELTADSVFRSRRICSDSTLSPIKDAQGNVYAVGVVYRDITERIEAEEQRRHLEAQIQHAQKLESLGVLAGGIAHDFNNLLVGILGNADLALSELSPVSPARDSLVDIETAARRAAELCRQMLAYSGKGRFVIEPVLLNDIVEEMIHMLEISISKKAVLKFEFAENLSAVDADATQIRQVVMNLITNASEAIGEKSGVISVRTGMMDCDREYLHEAYLDDDLAEGQYVTLEVSDTGCGMSEEVRRKLFDPFFTTKFTGRGLGLAAVLGIIRGHHGAIKVYSEQGRGTTFKILLPCSADQTIMRDQPDERQPWHGKGHVLLADDEETIRAVSKRMLEKLGFEVALACNGEDAVEKYRAAPESFDAVILDLTMPKLDGEQTFRELRRIRPDVRVILSSGYNEQDVTQRFAGKRLAGFIQKPYKLEDFGEVLRRALQNENDAPNATESENADT